MFNIHWGNLTANWRIHHKEALIVVKSLERYKHLIRNKHINLFTDNMAGKKLIIPNWVKN